MKVISSRKPVEDRKVYVLAAVPEELHRYLKSEAALAKRKINDMVVDALSDWKALRERKD